jgi:hypothetical protein
MIGATAIARHGRIWQFFFTSGRSMSSVSLSDWKSRGKTISQLIEELRSFENQDMEVRISVDGGTSSVPISLVAKSDGSFALLLNCEEAPGVIAHHE